MRGIFIGCSNSFGDINGNMRLKCRFSGFDAGVYIAYRIDGGCAALVSLLEKTALQNISAGLMLSIRMLLHAFLEFAMRKRSMICKHSAPDVEMLLFQVTLLGLWVIPFLFATSMHFYKLMAAHALWTLGCFALIP